MINLIINKGGLFASRESQVYKALHMIKKKTRKCKHCGRTHEVLEDTDRELTEEEKRLIEEYAKIIAEAIMYQHNPEHIERIWKEEKGMK